MISSNDFRNGVTIEIDNNAWQIIDFQHVKPGKGAAFVRAKLKNLRTGAVVERTFNAGEKVAKGHVDKRKMQFLYLSDGLYNFMDNENYEQVELTKEQLGIAVNFMKENMDIDVMFFQGQVIGIDLPTSVELVVTETDPGIKGDTATGGSKSAVLETGHTVRVPLFIEQGDVLRVDTRSGEYIERASK
ncbi:MAG: elongation factor P [Negativicutes bacterium]|jgi:elongation factor P